jgi:DNA polymerase III sliding clamp (beta) subunit (PCNA family)
VLETDILSWLDETTPVHSVVPVKTSRANTLTSSGISGTCFEIKREVLLSLLEQAIVVVPTRDIIPVLLNFQVSAQDGVLTIVGSSTEMAVVISTEQVTISVEGTELFPAKTFLSVVKETAPGSTVYVEATATGLVIVAGTYTAEIALPGGKGFKNPENVDSLKFHEIDRAGFISAINSVKYALPGKESSAQDSMNMISIKGGKFTACDGSRFQQVRIDGFKLNMQLPTASVTTLLKVLSSTDQEFLEIGELPKRLIFKFGRTVFYFNKITDPYPNVEQLWLRPALSNDQEFLINRQELITAIKQVKVAADSTSYAIGLIVNSDSVKIVAKDTNNSASATIACKWSGKERIVVVNYTHFAEMLKAYPKDECRFLLGEDTKTHKPPILLKDDDTMAMATIAQMLSYRAGLVDSK